MNKYIARFIRGIFMRKVKCKNKDLPTIIYIYRCWLSEKIMVKISDTMKYLIGCESQ